MKKMNLNGMRIIIKFLLNYFPRSILIRLSIIFRPVFNFLFSGDKFLDPINEKSYSRFFPYGYNNPRKNALSLGTLSLERHRLLWLYLKNETSFFNVNNKILHIAPEQCFYYFFKKYFKDYYTADLNSPLAEYKVDICKMPFNDNSFDFILCNHVLEHVYDDDLAIIELRRVLKNNGVAILQVPLDLKLKNTIDGRDINNLKKRNELFGQYDHLRVYGNDFFDKIKKHGFNVKRVKYCDNLSVNQIKKYGLIKEEIIPYCVKVQ